MKWLLPVVGIVLVLVYLAAGSAAPVPSEYADPQSCAGCHTKIAQTYRLTGMARSFYRPLNSTAATAAPFFQKESATWYGMSKQDGKLFQRRWRTGYDGQPAETQELSVDYVMGSGNHVRTYLHQTGRGTLIELPLAWYAEGGGRWGMNPGHDRAYELPPRTVAYECMSCHNSYPKIPPGHDEPGSEPVYLGPLPEGIDCQRCHGPGADHVRAAKQAGSSRETVRQAIVNPAHLSPDRQLEVCMQCHLETASQGLPHSIQRYGRGPFSYRPGEPLGDFEIFFDRAPKSGHEDDFEIAHSAYRLRKSRCFLESRAGGAKAALTCTTCHNPHDIPRGEEADAHYNQVCLGCHASKLRPLISSGAHTSANTCTGCHMPKRRTTDVVNAVMTDHLITRRPPAGDPLRQLAERHDPDYRGPVVPYYPEPLPNTEENALYVAIAQTTQGNNLAAGLPLLASRVERQRPARPEFHMELGQAWLMAGNKPAAVKAFEEAVRQEPQSPVAALALGDALTQVGQPAQAIGVLEDALKIAPGDPLLWYQLGLAHSVGGQAPEAATALEKSVSLDPNLADAYSELGIVRAGSGDLPRAETALRASLRIQPDQVEALGVLAEVLGARRDFPQAIYYSQRAVRLKPGDGEIRLSYADLLTRASRWDEALSQVREALKVDQNSPEAHNLLGSLLERKSDPAGALGEFLLAIRLRSDFGLAHLNAARLLLARGDVAGARGHLEQAAKDHDPKIRERALAEMRN